MQARSPVRHHACGVFLYMLYLKTEFRQSAIMLNSWNKKSKKRGGWYNNIDKLFNAPNIYRSVQYLKETHNG